MLVSKIEYQKRDPSRVNIYLDDEFFCGISLNTLASENLYEGLEIDDSVVQRILERDLKSRFLTRVTEYISRTPKTELQVRRYLRGLRFKKRNIWFKEDISLDWDIFFEDIVRKLKDYKYIDDEIFARTFVQSRVSYKPRGKNILVMELISKGVSKDIANQVCDEEIGDELELIGRTFRKKYKESKFNIKDVKMVSFLQRKGFSWDLIERFSRDDTTE